MTDLKARRRTALLIAGLLALAAAPAANSAAQTTPDLSGMWWASSYSPSIKTYLVGGGDVPLNDAGKKKYAESQAGLKDGSITDRARRYCTPDGLPRTLSTPYPFQIIGAPPGQMSWVYEQNRMIRGISMVKPSTAMTSSPFFPSGTAIPRGALTATHSSSRAPASTRILSWIPPGFRTAISSKPPS